MEYLLLFLGIAILVLLVVIIRRTSTPPHESGETALLMQQQVESLRSDVRANLQHVVDQMNHQLSGVSQQMQSQTATVGTRLDNAARVIMDVQKNLGDLGRAAQEMKELGQSVSKLEELLRAPKLRGGLGEFLLEDLLSQILPAEHFEVQHRFRNGQIVDAVIQTADRLVPVDSKFPLENFRKMVDESVSGDGKEYRRLFIGDVKRHIDAIATKYILPDEGTFSFALMYIPAENIYYEVIIRHETTQDGGLYDYALSRHVIPVSPNSLYAYLQVIALGLRGLRIEQGAREIVSDLARLEGDLRKFREVFDVLGTHLENAGKKYGEADKRLAGFEQKLETIEERTIPEHHQSQLPPQATR